MIQINPRSKEGSLAKYISSTLNMGERNEKKAINILKNADEETKQAVFNHKKTINQADKETQLKKESHQKTKTEQESLKNDFQLQGEPFWEGFENADEKTKEEIISGEKIFSDIVMEKENSEKTKTFQKITNSINKFWNLWKKEHEEEDTKREFSFWEQFLKYYWDSWN